MNRPIEFRAWNTGSKVMIFSEEIGIFNFWRLVEGAGPLAKVMQYTGLKDKNGVKIFEGDIVSTKHVNHEPRIYRVYWQQFRLTWAVTRSRHANNNLFSYSRPDCSIEVIGNIHSNPELLND